MPLAPAQPQLTDKSHTSCLNKRVRFSEGAVRYSLRPSHYIFAVVLAIRVIALTRLTGSPFLLPAHGDMHFYDQWAQHILRGQLTEPTAFYGLPLYAYFLALIYKGFGYGPFLPGLLQANADAGTAMLLYKIAVRVFSSAQRRDGKGGLVSGLINDRGQLVGLVAACGWAFFVPAQAYTVILMPTSFLVFVFWLLVWLVVRNDFQPSARECLVVGILIGFSAMAVATVLFLVPLIVAALLLKRRIDNRSRLRSAATGTALMFAGIITGASPCWIHNFLIARDPVFLSAHSGINFWIGNNPSANGYPKFPPGLRAGQAAMLEDSITRAEMAAGHTLKRAEVSAYWSGKAREYIANHPGEWLKLVAIKARNFWNAFQYDDLSVVTNLRDGGVIFPGIYFGCVAALAIPGMLLGWRLAPRSRWITAAVLLQMAALLPVFLTERYRIAAVPGLLLLAVFGLSILWQSWLSGRWRVATVYAVLLAGSTIAVSAPQRDPSLWALDAYNSGWQALQTENLSLAENKLDLAYAYVPENAEINFALGNLRLAQSDKAAAKAFYVHTVRLDPRHAGAFNNLAILAMDDSQWAIAAKFLQRALQQEPSDAKTYYLLAQAHFHQGNIDDARSEIAQALKLNPTQPEFSALRQQIEAQSE